MFKISKIVLIVISISILISFSVFQISKIENNNSTYPEDLDFSDRVLLLKTQEYITNDPILIESDVEFLDQKSNEGWAGTGELSDPIVIQGYKISGTTQHCIEMGDTKLHFVIRDCYLDGKQIFDSIVLSGTSNGIITDNIIKNAAWGMAIVSGCNNIIITNNSISQSVNNGIDLTWGSKNSQIINNSIYLSGANGIHLGGIEIQDCNSIISNNKIYSNSGLGMLIQTGGNLISNNAVYSNAAHGIHLSGVGSINNTLNENIIANNRGTFISYGIKSDDLTANNIIRYNDFIGHESESNNQAFDSGNNNTWDGNYWADQEQSFYNITGGISQDLSPLEKPYHFGNFFFIKPIIENDFTETTEFEWTKIDWELVYYKLSYSLDNGSTWEEIATINTFNKYNWTIPSEMKNENCKFQIIATTSLGFEIESYTDVLFISLDNNNEATSLSLFAFLASFFSLIFFKKRNNTR